MCSNVDFLIKKSIFIRKEIVPISFAFSLNYRFNFYFDIFLKLTAVSLYTWWELIWRCRLLIVLVIWINRPRRLMSFSLLRHLHDWFLYISLQQIDRLSRTQLSVSGRSLWLAEIPLQSFDNKFIRWLGYQRFKIRLAPQRQHQIWIF